MKKIKKCGVVYNRRSSGVDIKKQKYNSKSKYFVTISVYSAVVLSAKGFEEVDKVIVEGKRNAYVFKNTPELFAFLNSGITENKVS